MSVDWITVAAQIANFLVLVWLLKRFLYRPILDGIDAREAEIAARMREASDAEAQARAVERDYHAQAEALKAAQADLTDTVRRKAEAQRDALLAETRDAMERERAAWIAERDGEKREFAARMHRAGASALLDLTRKALGDLADESLEQRMARCLVRQLEPMSPELRRAAGDAVEAVVTSRDPLPDAGRDAVRSELGALFPGLAVRFEADAEQSPGLVLSIGGAQVAWTVESYIAGLDAMIDARLDSGPEQRERAHGP